MRKFLKRFNEGNAIQKLLLGIPLATAFLLTHWTLSAYLSPTKNLPVAYADQKRTIIIEVTDIDYPNAFHPKATATVSISDPSERAKCSTLNAEFTEDGAEMKGGIRLSFTCQDGAKIPTDKVFVAVTPNQDNYAPATGTLASLQQDGDLLSNPGFYSINGLTSGTNVLDFSPAMKTGDGPWSQCVPFGSCTDNRYSLPLARYDDKILLEMTTPTAPTPPRTTIPVAINQPVAVSGKGLYSSHNVDGCWSDYQILLLGKKGSSYFLLGEQTGTFVSNSAPQEFQWSMSPTFSVDALNAATGVSGQLGSLSDGDQFQVRAVIYYDGTYLDIHGDFRPKLISIWNNTLGGSAGTQFSECYTNTNIVTMEVVEPKANLSVAAGKQFSETIAGTTVNTNAWSSSAQSIFSKFEITPTTLQDESSGAGTRSPISPLKYNGTDTHCGTAKPCAWWKGIYLDNGEIPVTIKISPEDKTPDGKTYEPVETTVTLHSSNIVGINDEVICYWATDGTSTGCSSNSDLIDQVDDRADPIPAEVALCIPPEMLNFSMGWFYKHIVQALCSIVDISVESTFPLLDVNIPLLTTTDDADGNKVPALERRLMFTNYIATSSSTGGGHGIGAALTAAFANSYTPTAVYKLWETAYSIARVVVVFALVFYAMMIIYRVDVNKYSMRQFITNALFAILLASFSYQICTFMFDLNKIAALIVNDTLFGVLKDEAAAGNVLDFSGWVEKFLNWFAVGGTVGGVIFAASQLFAGATAILPCLGCMASYALSIISLWLVMFARAIFLYIMVIVSPIVFMLRLIPEFKGLTSAWFKNMTRILTVYPIIVLVYNLLTVVGTLFGN